MSEVTKILHQLEAGDEHAAAELLPLLYNELRRLAAAKMASENPGQTLQATALVHEAFIRLVGAKNAQNWDSRGHFFAAASEAMRRILIENARRKHGKKAGGGLHRVDVELPELDTGLSAEELLDLDEALDELGRHDPIKARVVTLRYFGGLTTDEAADVCGISRVTAYRHWRYARAWLFKRLRSKNMG